MKKIFFVMLPVLMSTLASADSKMILGLDVYNNKAHCGTCHTLQAAGSKSEIGPDFDRLKPQISQIIYAVKNGVGVMPAWEGILTFEEIEAVAYYIFNSTNE